jgi:hypothetical protein
VEGFCAIAAASGIEGNENGKCWEVNIMNKINNA